MNINTKRILIALGGDLYLTYDDIICILESKEIEKTLWIKGKKIIKLEEEEYNIKSYIYCKNDFLISTSMDITILKNKLNKETLKYLNTNIFK